MSSRPPSSRASTPTRPRARAKVSRRRFMAMIAGASAATLAAPARPLLAAARKPVPLPKQPAPSPRIAAEIEKQKKYVADTLKVIRGFQLPPGSDMAFEFRPMGPKRRR